MASAKPPSIRILKPGTFTDVHGTKVTFTPADLAGMVEGYDAAADPAPLVIGHPKIDAPAYGWVSGLRLDREGHVVAEADKIAPAFAEAVRAGHYRKISPQLYPPAHPSNPTPGRWSLMHVGFLGGAAPAIKGLGTVAFADADDDQLVAPIIEENEMSTETAPNIAEREVALAGRENDVATRETELAEREAAIAAREAATAEAEAAARHDGNVAFADGLITAGTLAPAAKDRVVGLMDLLDASIVFAFGEGDSAEQTPLAAFRSLFDGAQPVVALGEHAGVDKTVVPSVTVSFSAPPGYSVDPAAAALHARASELRQADPSLELWESVRRAQAEIAAG